MKALARVPQRPEPNVVTLLEQWLARARAGELRAVFITGVVQDTQGEASIYAVTCGKWVWRDALLGAVERAKAAVLRDWLDE